MTIKVGVIGLGYWGPNYVRNFVRCEQSKVVYICDTNDSQLTKIANIYPNITTIKDYKQMLIDPKLDCVAVATPPETHHEIVKNCLAARKHVLVAKPLTLSSTTSKKLLALAKRKKLQLATDLTFLFSPTIREIKKIIDSKQIGRPLYYDSTRTNLGLIQQNVNVLWDLAIHDLSIIDYWLGLKPKRVFAVASRHLKNSKTFEMAHLTIEYANNFIAHIHVSWLSPVKIRTILVGGNSKMIVFDDVEPDEKIKIYEKGVDIQSDKTTPFKPLYRSGQIIIPKVDNEEGLFIEAKEFISQIQTRKLNYNNAQINIRILEILEACDRSIKTAGVVTL